MAGLSSISNIWNNVKEIDLRPIKQAALQMVRIAIIGAEAERRASLAAQLRRDPQKDLMETQTPLLLTGWENAQQADGADLIILLVDQNIADISQENKQIHQWLEAGKKLLVIASDPSLSLEGSGWRQLKILYGGVDDADFLQTEFVPVVINLFPDRILALGRYFPLFRATITQNLITDTSFSNAAYAFSTGLAEIVPIFDIPLNVADMVVLSKAQAFLVYKLGLALGLSTEWRDYVAEFGSVLGGGFLWRQLARSLIGLIPAWGIVPKVAVSYAGTYVVGTVIYQWYLTGRHVSRQQISAMYRQAFERGKEVAGNLVNKVPRPRTPTKKRLSLPAPVRGRRICPHCGRKNAADAIFCQYCGKSLEAEEPDESNHPVV